MEVQTALSDPVTLRLTGEANLRIDVEDDHQVGDDTVEDRFVEPPDSLDSEPTPTALVSERRVVGAVGDHPHAIGERRGDDLRSELGTRRSEEGGLCPRRNVACVQHEATQLLAEFGSSRLPDRDEIDLAC